jgi:hypothetical protein
LVSARVYPRATFVGLAAAFASCAALALLEPATNAVELVVLGYLVLHGTYVGVWFWWGGEAWDVAQDALPNQESSLERRLRFVISGWLLGLGVMAVYAVLPRLGLGVILLLNFGVVLVLNRVWLRHRERKAESASEKKGLVGKPVR